MSTVPLPAGPSYEPRDATSSVLHRIVRDHVETFIERTEFGGRELPAFVKVEFRRFLECGVFSYGFARFVCGSCQHNRIVPFSCKSRGICPSCCGRRMAEAAAHLVDSVIPHVPVRQWVLSLPFSLRAPVAYDPRLRRLVLRAFIRAIYARLRRHARRLGIQDPECGSVTIEQRFGSDLRLNLHFHVLALDGVISDATGQPEFHPIPPPTEEELARLVRRVHRQVVRALQRGGWLDDEGHWVGTEDEAPVECELAAASAAGRIAQGKRRGMRVPGVDPLARFEAQPTTGRMSARVGGFDVHAGVACEAHERTALERLCRYIARPAIALERLELTERGRVRYHFRKPWRNGTTFVELDPLEFLERLVPLIPRPRLNLIHFHGVLAPRSRLRSLVVPRPNAVDDGCGHGGLVEPEVQVLPVPAPPEFALRQLSKRTWAQLISRVFQSDPLECPACPSGRLRLVAFITHPETIYKILRAMKLPTDAPAPAPARPPPEDALTF